MKYFLSCFFVYNIVHVRALGVILNVVYNLTKQFQNDDVKTKHNHRCVGWGTMIIKGPHIN